MTCEKCTDLDGESCFPLYGLGPHKHVAFDIDGMACMKTVMLEDQTAPGFTPDPDVPGLGVWWCPHCEDGRPESALDKATGGTARNMLCRNDGRCQYAIDHGAEGAGHCPVGKCAMQAERRLIAMKAETWNSSS